MTALCSQICENKNSYGYCKTTYCINPLVRMGGLDYQLGFTQGYAKAKAEAEPKHGRWENNQNGTFTCSECGCKHSRSRFCPNCGARMVDNENL